MTFNGVMAVILRYFSKFSTLRRQKGMYRNYWPMSLLQAQNSVADS